MSSVDTRVVEMRFDNSQFESGIKSSMSSLEKLKASLDLKSSEKSLESLEAAGKKFSLAGIGDSIDELNNKFSTMGIIGMTAISNITNNAINSLRGITSSVTGLIKTGGINRALNIESAKFQLEGLGVAWDSISEDINYGVQDTAYGLDAAAKVASQLVASGVQIGDTMKSDLRAISGVAAMTNATYEDIGQIFTTVAGNGKLMTEQLRQFSVRGLNVAAVLGEQLGKSEAEIRDMVTKGKIDFQTFASAMDSAFGEHAKDANKTFTGALSNMKAAFSRIGADIATPAMEMLRVMMNALIPVINAIRSELAPAIEALSYKMKVLGYFVKLVLEDVNNSGLSKLVATIKAIKNALTPTEKTLNKLGRTFDGFIAVLDILVEIVDAALVPILEALGFTMENIGGGVLSITANIGDMLCEFRDWVLENQVVQNTFGLLGKGIAAVIKYIGQIIDKVEESGVIDSAFTTITAVLTNLFNLISGQAPNVTDVLEDFKDGLLDLIQNFSLDKLIDTFKDLGDAILGVKDNISDAATAVESTGKGLPKLESSFSGVTSGVSAFIEKLKSLITFENGAKVIALALGATSVKLGSSIGKLIDKIIKIKDPIGVLTTGIDNLFKTLSYSVTQISKSVSRAANAVALKNFAEAILMLVGAIAILALLPDKSRIQDSLVTIGLLVVVMSGVMKLMTITPAGTASMASIAAAFLGLAAALVVMGGVVVEMKKVAEGFKSFQDVFLTFGTLVTAAGTLVIFTKLISGVAKDLSASVFLLIPIAASLYVFAVGLQKLANVDIGNLGEFMLKLVVFFGYFKVVSSMAESLTGGAALALISISATILIFAEAIKKMSNIGLDKVLLSLPGMIECILFIKIILKALSSMKKEALKVGGTVLAIAAAMDLMVIAIKAFGKMKIEDVITAVAMMTPIMALFAGIIAITHFAGENAAKAGVTLLAMAVSIDLLAVAIALLSMLDTKAVARATLYIAEIMAMCAVVIASTYLVRAASKTIAMIAVLIGVLTGCVALLTFLDQNKLQSTVDTMSAVILSLSAMFVAIGLMGTPAKEAILTIGVVAAVLAEVAIVLGLLSNLTDADSTLKIAESISMILIAMAAVMAVAAGVGLVGAAATEGLITMASVIGIITGIIGALGSLINALGVGDEILAGLDLMTQILEKAGEAIGSFFGGAVSGLLTSATSGLGQVGQNLSDFAENISGFLDTIKEINPDQITSVEALVSIITALAKGKISSNLMSIFGGNGDNLIDQFGQLGEAIATFSDKVKDVDPSNLESASTAAKYLAKIIAVIPKKGGLKGFIFGNTMDMGTFSEGLESYGEALVSFSNAVSGEDFDVKAIKSAAKASMSLSDLVDSLPETGGVLQDFFGSYDLELFGNQLAKYAYCLVVMSNTFKNGQFNTDSCALIQAASDATEPLIEMCGKLDPTGGAIQNLTGNKDISLFGENLKSYAESLVTVSTTLKDGEIDYDAIENARACTEDLINLSEMLSPTGGLQELFSGKQDFSALGTNLEDYGQSLSVFNTKIADVDMGKLQSGITQSKALVLMLKDVSTNAGTISEGEGYFSSALTDFGIAIQTYYSYIKDIKEKKVDTIANACNKLMNVGMSIQNSNPAQWKIFGNCLSVFGEKFANFYDKVKGVETLKLGTLATSFKDLADLTKSLKSISGASFANVSEAFNQVGKVSITKMNAQFVTGKKTVMSSIKSLMSSAIDEVKGRKQEMAQSATYVCLGFVNGVNANINGIQNAGTKVGQKFLEKLNAALDINSPSEETKQSGIYAVTGLINGVTSGLSSISDAGTSVGTSLADGITSSIKGSSESVIGKVSGLVDDVKNKWSESKKAIDAEIANSASSTASSLTSSTTSAISSSTKTTTKAATKSVKKTASSTAKAAKKYYKQVGKEILRALNDGVTKGNYLTAAKATTEQLITVGKNVAKQVQSSLKSSKGIFDDYWEELNESSKKSTTKTTATLAEAANAFVKFKDSIKDSLESAMDSFKAFEASTDTVSTKDVISNLKSQINAVNNYKLLVKRLKAMGYSKEVIKTITDMGVSDGTTYAKALIQASKKQVKEINAQVKSKSSLAENSADVIAAVFVNAEKAASSAKKTSSKTTKSISKNSSKVSKTIKKSGTVVTELSNETIEKFKEMAVEAGMSNDLIETLIESSKDWVETMVNAGTAGVIGIQDTAKKEAAAIQDIYESMAYGSDTAEAYINKFYDVDDATRVSAETVTAAKKAVQAYAKSLYYATDAGKTEKAELHELKQTYKDSKEELENLRKERDKISKTKEPEKWKEAQEAVKAYKLVVQDNLQAVNDKASEIADNIKENWDSLSSSLTESFKNAMSGLSISYDTGIDPFTEYSEDTETTMETMLSNFQSQLNAYATYRNNLLQLYEMKESGVVSQSTYDYISSLGRDGEAYLNAVVNATDDEREQLDSLLQQNTQATSETLIQNAKDQAANLIEYQNTLISLADKGFDANTLYELFESGYSEENLARAEAFDQLSDDQIQEWNDVQATGEEAASTAASKILAAYIGETEKTGNAIQSILTGDAGALTTSITVAVSDAVDEALTTVSEDKEAESNATGKTVVFGIADGISKNTSTVVKEAKTTGKKTLSGLSKYINEDNGLSVSTQMCSGIVTGFTNARDSIVEAAEDIVSAAMDALDAMSEYAEEVGSYSGSGLSSGLKGSASSVASSASMLGTTVYSSTASALKVSSPSKVMMEIGRYAAMGLANGLSDNVGLVKNSTEVLTNATLSSTREIASQIQDILDSGLDISPTITPVLDLSQTKTGLSQLSTLMSKNQALSAYNDISAAREAKQAADAQSQVVNVNNNYNMEQNNYSPKALSNIDIYRRTKNQMSALKGVQNNAKIRYSY
jgi:hypothetical protein